MIDSRRAFQANIADWLRVRANVRVLVAKVAAAQYALGRDAAKSDDPPLATLVAQLATERDALEALGRELDERIAVVRRAAAALEAGIVRALVGH